LIPRITVEHRYYDIDISKIRLVSNTTQSKRVGMIGYGLEITEYVRAINSVDSFIFS
jgi:GTP cyclohydrolase II